MPFKANSWLPFWAETLAILVAVLVLPFWLGFRDAKPAAMLGYIAAGAPAMTIGEQLQFGRGRIVLAWDDLFLWAAAIGIGGGFLNTFAIWLF